jgi:HEAT repeat protein
MVGLADQRCTSVPVDPPCVSTLDRQPWLALHRGVFRALAAGLALAWVFVWVSGSPAIEQIPAQPAERPPETPAEPAPDQPSPKSAQKKPQKKAAWLETVEDGQRQALADRKPVLVRVGAEWCQHCRRLAAEIEKPSVQDELARWTPVYLDLNASEGEARELGVAGVPAIRLRTPSGELVASRDGFVEAGELVRWLQENYEAARAQPDDALLGAGKPDAATVARLVGQFGQRSPAVREAAIRRLAPYAADARPAVVQSFTEGKLANRLTAMELLTQWRAPIGGMDPWQPESFTPQRAAALRGWLARPAAAGERKPPTAHELASARRDIDRMLKTDAAEAEAIVQRLARLGAALVPEVTARLKEAAGDRDRQRLLVLRYGLVAADSLALRWPGGLARLAAANPRQRQKAAEELAKLASRDDQALLTELFSDPDPLVREVSLRGLQNIGGSQAAAALVQLLADPEPNVRAAVLKQLEQQPQPAMVPKVAEYLEHEQDPDLVVHGIRFLRASGGLAAVRAMLPLLRHESWQVRAEAAEALTKASDLHRSSSNENDPSAKLQADVYAAMLELLDDPDPFVISRAVQGLSGADLSLTLEPLIQAAQKHPDLAPSIVPLLANGNRGKVKVIVVLRKFLKHADPPVRAAALKALAEVAQGDVAAEAAAAISDPDVKVRIAAAGVAMKALEGLRNAYNNERRSRRRGSAVRHEQFSEVAEPSEGAIAAALRFFGVPAGAPLPAVPAQPPAVPAPKAAESKPEPKPDGSKPAPKAEPKSNGLKPEPAKPAKPAEEPWDVWLRECYAGKHRPAWMAELVGPLEKMLASKDADERMAAAVVLVPLGRRPAALAVLGELARSKAEARGAAGAVLPWLVWDERLKFFQELRALPGAENNDWAAVHFMAEVPDHRAIDLYWKLLGEPKAVEYVASGLERALLQIHGRDPYSWSSDDRNPNPAESRALAVMANQWAARGTDLQRLVALALLTYADADAAVELAEKLLSDSKQSGDLRTDAFKILLCLENKKKATARAVAALAAPEKPRREAALEYLVFGPSYRLSSVRGLSINTSREGEVRTSGQPLVFTPPEGLKPEPLRPLLADPQPSVAAGAGYLLALLGEADGLDVLLRRYKDLKQADSDWTHLVVRAIATLDDSSRINVLREIYAEMEKENYEISPFYWTIRVMTGPEILRFRKQIRDEVGMSQLR